MKPSAITARTRSLDDHDALAIHAVEQHARDRPGQHHRETARDSMIPATTRPDPVFASARLNTAMLL